MATEDTINGACNCGAIKISIPKSSLPTYCGLCHCLNCRASSGSLFSVNLPTPTKDISIIGEPKIYIDRNTDSGHTVGRRFCGDCGSAIMSIVAEKPDNAFVKGGLFAKNGYVIPPAVLEVYWRNAERWEKPTEGVARLQGTVGSEPVT